MEITAQLNNLRIAPRKVRLVSKSIKGLDAIYALRRLDYLAKRSGQPLAKLIDSALANAQNNFGLAKENLFIKNIIVNEGAKLKRFRPKGFGMTSPIEKKTSRVTIILDERTPGIKAEKKTANLTGSWQAKVEPTPAESEESAGIKEKTLEKKPSFRSREIQEQKKKGMFSGIKGLGRRFFRRKAI